MPKPYHSYRVSKAETASILWSPLTAAKKSQSKFQKIKINVSYLTDLFHIFVTIESAAEALPALLRQQPAIHFRW